MVAKRRKGCYPAFSSFPIIFRNGFSLRVVKARDFLVKGLAHRPVLCINVREATQNLVGNIYTTVSVLVEIDQKQERLFGAPCCIIYLLFHQEDYFNCIAAVTTPIYTH